MEFGYMSDLNSSEVEAGTVPNSGDEHATLRSSDDVTTGSSSSSGIQH